MILNSFRKYFSITVGLLLCFLLISCASPVQKEEYQKAVSMPQDAHPAPVKFSKAEFIIPPGTDIGFESDSARFCGWPRHPVSRTVLKKALEAKFARQSFHDALEAQGYDVVGSLDLAYNLEDEDKRAEYSITAKITEVQLELCEKDADDFMLFFASHKGSSGEFFMKVDWSIYDALHRKVVYRTTTKGYTKRRTPNQEGLELMLLDAFEMATHNLGTDKNFYNLLVNGATPPMENPFQKAQKEKQNRPTQFAPDEAVFVKTHPLFQDSFRINSQQALSNTLMIQKIGHGSGIFITKQGHILTSADVVGDGKRTRIITHNKKHKLTAETLRMDKTRNVALLKLESIPENLHIKPVPIKLNWPEISDTVYTISTPKDYYISQNSVSKGIISAHRHKIKLSRPKMDYLQADVEIHKGSEGAPLFDSKGNLVGIAAAYQTAPENTGIGLNYFTPIEEALKALDISY